ncbi:MAG: hypothetical protein IIC85_13010 [Chloroflexi bacterium]|nr:hypothetical protein [Chloroflexota bacterium]
MIYCRPNCPPGRRTRPENRVEFASFRAAMDAGYRACKVCKPEVGVYGPWTPKSARPVAAGPGCRPNRIALSV